MIKIFKKIIIGIAWVMITGAVLAVAAFLVYLVFFFGKIVMGHHH
jgi:hypothetical protein